MNQALYAYMNNKKKKAILTKKKPMDVPSISPTVTLEYSTPLKRVTVFFSA
jgi:hypothetical protein